MFAVLAAGSVNAVAVERIYVSLEHAGVEVDLLAALKIEDYLTISVVILHYKTVRLEFLSIQDVHASHVHRNSSVGVLGDRDIAVIRKLVDVHIELVVQLVGAVLVGVAHLLLRNALVELIHLAEQVVYICHGVLGFADVCVLDFSELCAVIVEDTAEIRCRIHRYGSDFGGVRALYRVIL